MFCLATFSIDGIPSIFNSVVTKELKTVGENSQDSKNPTEKPVGETEKKICDEYYCKCCFTFETHNN